MAFTVFYDGDCPLCSFEIGHLQKHDSDNELVFVDIMAADFTEKFPQADWHAMNAKIHGLMEDGTWLVGLDVTHQAWKRVGKGWIYAPLRWPVISWFADHAYVFFARYRHPIAKLLTGKARCESSCENKL